MLPLDYEALAREVLRELRGKRSQVAFSRRLKYRSNVAYLWESGRNWPTAAVALSAATRVGIDVTAAVGQFYRAAPTWLETTDLCTRDGVAALLEDLRGDTPILELASRAQRSRFAVARWLQGKAEPRLPDFLRLVEATSQRVLDFLAQLVDVSALPSAAPAWQQLQAARKLIAKLPWSPAVLLALQTEAYLQLQSHEPGWIAARIGIPEDVERECIELLEASGQIQRIKGRFEVTRVQAIDTRSDPASGLRLKQWWARVGLDAIAAEKPGLFSFNVFSVSDADLERLREMHRSYYRALRAVVAASEPPQRVVVANVQLFALDEC